MDDLKPLGLEMAKSLVVALGGDPKADRGLWQGRNRRRGRRDRTRRAVARPGRVRDARGSGRRQGDRASTKKVGGPGRTPRRAHHAYQCVLRAQPFRRDGSRCRRCAPRRRNIARAGDDHRRRRCTPASAASRLARSRERTGCDEGQDPQDRDLRRGDAKRDGRQIESADAARRCGRGNRESLRRKVCRRPLAADDIGEELGELLDATRGRSARHRGPPRKAMARPRPSARMASSSMPPPSCIPSWARRCARCWARARP